MVKRKKMNKYFIILLLVLGCAVSYGQNIVPRTNDSFTTQDSRWAALYNMFAPRYADTTAANVKIGIDSCGAVIFTYDVMGLWYRACSPKRWVWLLPESTTASQGITMSGYDIRLFGTIASPSRLSTERALMIERNTFQLTNGTTPEAGGPIWQHTDRSYSPIIIDTRDTLTANDIDPPTAAMPLSAVFARRTMYIADGILRTQKIYGHYFTQIFDWKDSMQFRTEGGDYNQSFIAELSLNPRGTGRQVAQAGISAGQAITPYYGVPALLANIITRSTASNYVYTRGWLVGVSSYLVLGAGGQSIDTADRVSFIQTNAFIVGSSHVKKAYQFDMQNYTSGARVDSSFGLWDQNGYRHWLRGKTVIGESFDSSVTGYNLKVSGAMYMRGLHQGFQGTDVASTAGVMTLPGSGTAGNIYEITGTNTITAINNTNLKNGYEVTFIFTTTATLTDGTANSGAAIGMELSGNTNFTATAGDAVTLILAEIGGTQRWREKCRSDN